MDRGDSNIAFARTLTRYFHTRLSSAGIIVPVIMLISAQHAEAQDISFRSPTGNVHCVIFAGDYSAARCDLTTFTPSFSRPADCDLDWGFAFEVQPTGPGAPLCAGDTVMDPRAAVLDYGHSVTGAGITCTSATTGMTCKNAEGHGFSIARAKQQVF